MSLVERENSSLPALNTSPFEHASKQAKPRWMNASIFGYIILFLFFVVLGGWAAVAPLSSAIIAPGKLMVDSQIKRIQHPDGGIVSEIFVRDGDAVEEGQVLARLENKEARAQEKRMRAKLLEDKILRSRWYAEMVGDTALTLPKDLQARRTDPVIQGLVAEQEQLLLTRRQTLDGKIDLQLNSMDQLQLEIASLEQQLVAVRQQKDLIKKEFDDVTLLFNKGLERKSRLRAIERADSDLDGKISQIEGMIARGREQMNGVQLKIIDIQKQFEGGALQQMAALDSSIRDMEKRLTIVEEKLRRLDIVAPRSGRIFGSVVSTIGGFVNRGVVIMQLVPNDDELVVEARIKQRDIDNLQDVTNVQVRLTSFNQRFTHPINAKLISVSDSVVEGRGEPHYRAIVHLDKESLESIIPDAQLRSGMPAMTMIGVGQQSLLSYIVEPLFLSFYLALREPS
ncbi:HlyD family type I secretion periplasmic adaptor subunit [Alphaproteobacteria bacterium]|nr:HlyD family type I secretion periplasmic adaptor subunit [Alphaproteobacteria bacterium]